MSFTEYEKLICISVTGAFWLAQGASLMPFFAVGASYSSTGNSVEGLETTGYHATAGTQPMIYQSIENQIITLRKVYTM